MALIPAVLGGGGLTKLWEQSAATYAGGTVTISGLDNYDTIIMAFVYNSTVYYSGFKLSELSTAKNFGYVLNESSYIYGMYRIVTHSAANTLTISTGNYMRNGGAGSGAQYAVPSAIYGVNS